MHERYYYAYIVASRSLTLYIGMTSDLEKRIFEHKCKLHDGFSAQYNCDRLVWFERFSGPRAAIAREKQLKGWTRAKKIALITKTNPPWIDLSERWYAPEMLELALRQRGFELRRYDIRPNDRNAGPSTQRVRETHPLRSG